MAGRYERGGTIEGSEYGWTRRFIEIAALLFVFSEADCQRGNGRPL